MVFPRVMWGGIQIIHDQMPLGMSWQVKLPAPLSLWFKRQADGVIRAETSQVPDAQHGSTKVPITKNTLHINTLKIL